MKYNFLIMIIIMTTITIAIDEETNNNFLGDNELQSYTIISDNEIGNFLSNIITANPSLTIGTFLLLNFIVLTTVYNKRRNRKIIT